MIANTFIVSTESGPQVHILPAGLASHFWAGMTLARKHGLKDGLVLDVIKSTFGATAQGAVLASPEPVAVRIAETYTGPDQDSIRALAALLALGEPIPEGPADTGRGGTRVSVPDGPGPMGPKPVAARAGT